MIDNAPDRLMYIEPKKGKSELPTIDDLTQRMTAALRKSRLGILHEGELYEVTTAGFYECICGAKSDTNEHVLEDMSYQTNILAVHYLAWHREEVPQEELDKVATLPDEKAMPNEQELQ